MSRIEIDGVIYCCATCTWWNPDAGGCGMPETPATVNCGRTGPDDLCEQWQARPAPPDTSALERFQQKIATAQQRAIRMQHYLDGAVYGFDTRDIT